MILFHASGSSYMKRFRVCLLGFGNGGRALLRLLSAKSTELRENYGIEWELSGVATRGLGWRASSAPIDVAALLTGNDQTPVHDGIDEWLAIARPDGVFEKTSPNPEHGQPAT